MKHSSLFLSTHKLRLWTVHEIGSISYQDIWCHHVKRNKMRFGDHCISQKITTTMDHCSFQQRNPLVFPYPNCGGQYEALLGSLNPNSTLLLCLQMLMNTHHSNSFQFSNRLSFGHNLKQPDLSYLKLHGTRSLRLTDFF